MDDKNNPSNSTSAIVSTTFSYLDRVIHNDAARKGIAAAGAGLLVAAITEALWPSNR